MAPTWFFEEMFKKSIDPTDSGFAKAFCEKPNQNSNADNALLWDSKTYLNLNNGEKLIIQFSQPIRITKYQFQLISNRRFPTNWTLEASNNLINYKTVYSTIDIGADKMCTTLTNCDCGILMNKSYDLTKEFRINSIRLTIQKDSCQTTYNHIGAIDFYGFIDKVKTCLCRKHESKFVLSLIIICFC